MDHKTHPTADEIHADLVQEMPTMSLTTVYNTLKLLSEKGVISMLSIDNRNARFDYAIEPHAHFICRKCGRVMDVSLENQLNIPEEISGCTVESIEVCYKGVCDYCNKN
jgi:Fur family ferric uptake transcriptional regulator/Fur family peroxide stress response transcriptional regulator